MAQNPTASGPQKPAPREPSYLLTSETPNREKWSAFLLSHPIVSAFVTAVAVLLIIVMVLAATLWWHIRPVSQLSDVETSADQPRTILLLGIDSSSSQFEAQRSDVMMLIRTRENPRWIDIVSVPRDSQVTMPKCTGSHAGEMDKLNAAFAYGSITGDDTNSGTVPDSPAAAGMSCAATALSEASGISIHDSVAITFSGATDTIDALGGVDLPTDKNGLIVRNSKRPESAASEPSATPMVRHFTGAEVLKQLRARKTVADGSDLARINRQQEILGAILDYFRQREIVDNRGTIQSISDFTILLNTLAGETKHTLGIGEMQQLLRAVVSTPVSSATLPTRMAPDGVNVAWGSQAEEFWKLYREGIDLPR
ncbi:LCP family protein [Corynebacterium lactis]|uniref:LCP family protein n=1 Tax=Corynebacterium lactis TaxID=1231000 RepID=UPI000ACB682B|nr:LCP family protein [Corynebacterium lactis]